jgi:hypothetical protein
MKKYLKGSYFLLKETSNYLGDSEDDSTIKITASSSTLVSYPTIL